MFRELERENRVVISPKFQESFLKYLRKYEFGGKTWKYFFKFMGKLVKPFYPVHNWIRARQFARLISPWRDHSNISLRIYIFFIWE